MKRQLWLIITCALVAGFIIGVASGGIFTIHADQNKRAIPKENVIIVPAGGLVFKTPEGKLLARMDTDEAGGRFGVYHISGEPSAVMGTAPEGGGFAAYNKEGKPMCSLGTVEGHGVFGLYSKEGKTLFEAP